MDYLQKMNNLSSLEFRRVSSGIDLTLFQAWRTKLTEKEPVRAYFSLYCALDLNMKNIMSVLYAIVMLIKPQYKASSLLLFVPL